MKKKIQMKISILISRKVNNLIELQYIFKTLLFCTLLLNPKLLY